MKYGRLIPGNDPLASRRPGGRRALARISGKTWSAKQKRVGTKSPQTFLNRLIFWKKIVAVFYYNISISLLSFEPIFGTESSLNIKQIFKCE